MGETECSDPKIKSLHWLWQSYTDINPRLDAWLHKRYEQKRIPIIVYSIGTHYFTQFHDCHIHTHFQLQLPSQKLSVFHRPWIEKWHKGNICFLENLPMNCFTLSQIYVISN